MRESLRRIYHYYYRFARVSILGRVACLGNEILKRLKLEHGLINHQKSRIDFLLELNNKPTIYTDDREIYPFLRRTYIAGTIKQQKSNFFNKRQPNLIFMDSFSELTDQLFINKKTGKQFLANYSDINHNIDFSTTYACSGLLPLEDLEYYYEQFFTNLFQVYPHAKVFFIHFPTTLELREKFCLRGQAIITIIDRLSQKYENLYSIAVDDKLVFKSNNESDELKDFPYHYSEITYNAFVGKIQAILDNQRSLK